MKTKDNSVFGTYILSKPNVLSLKNYMTQNVQI
jgi:hypothetical protein